MRDQLATLLDDFRRYDREIAVVRYQGNRRRVTTYGELARLAGRFAALLVRRGIGPGDRVVLWGENGAEWLAAFHGCLLRGVVAVPLDAAGSADFAARVAADVKPKLAVGDAVLLDALGSHPGDKNKDVVPGPEGSPGAQVGHPFSEEENVPGSQNRDRGHPFSGMDGTQAEIPRVAFEDWRTELPAEEAGPVGGITHETPLEILFTSGTTGDPKGVVITHGNVLASVAPIEEGAQPYLRYERLVHPLRILHTLPLSHVYGQTMGLWVPQIFRAELHFESRLAAPRLIELIGRERISVLAAVPRVLALLKTDLEINYPWLAERVAASENIQGWRRWLRFGKIHRLFGLKFWAFVSGGGALAGPLEQFWNALGFLLVQGYGMTETTALITLNHPFHVARGTIGKPLAGREVKLGPDGEVLVRGAMISGATWAGGAMRPRADEWLATGDIAEREPSGDLKFLGRKSETIVTANGLNLHPEDVEAAIEEQPGIAACAVVAMETEGGPEPCAVLATRGSGDNVSEAIEKANARLAEFQRIRRWALYPEPDLPRTSTGKVKRKEVAAWLNRIQKAGAGTAHGGNAGTFGAQADWLLALIAQISGETPRAVGDELRLSEDLLLDSLGRVQLAAAIEQRLGIVSGSGLLEEVETLGALRRLIAGEAGAEASVSGLDSMDRKDHGIPGLSAEERGKDGARSDVAQAGREDDGARSGLDAAVISEREELSASVRLVQPNMPRTKFIYPTWPWWKPVHWMRAAFTEAVMRPLVWLLAAPRVTGAAELQIEEPILIVANHVSTYDGPLIEYALPGRLRRWTAAAMLGEMLEDFRHWRNPENPARQGFYLWGRPAYWLLTALFNVFPLPRRRDFQASFNHAGRALDRGYSVMVFPEGTRSAAGKLARFRPGIGILVKQSHTAVLPVGLRGLGELKTGKQRWFRSGSLEVHVGEPIRFASQTSEAEITERLHDEVERLMGEELGIGARD